MGCRCFGAVDDEYRLTIEVAGVDDVGAGQLVVRGHGDVVDGHPGERLRIDSLGVADRSADDAGCERAGANAVEDPQRRQPVGTHHAVGLAGAQGADRQHRRPLAAVAVAERQRQRHRREFAGGGGELLHRQEHRPGVGEQAHAGRGERHAPARALEQRHAERLLELADPLRERRSRDVQPRGGPAEVQFLGNGHEVPQPPKIRGHGRTLSVAT